MRRCCLVYVRFVFYVRFLFGEGRGADRGFDADVSEAKGRNETEWNGMETKRNETKRIG